MIEAAVLDRLRAARRPGESYSDMLGWEDESGAWRVFTLCGPVPPALSRSTNTRR